MRVLYFSRGYSPHDWRFLSELGRPRHDVFFLRLRPGAETLEARPLPDGVTPIEWPAGGAWSAGPLRWWRLVRDLRAVFRDVRPDVVHAGPVHSSGLLTALAGFKPLLLMSWGSDLLADADRNFLWRAAARFALRGSALLLVDSNAGRAKAKALTAYADDRIVVLPWGVDLDAFRPRPSLLPLKRDLGWEGKPTLLSLRSWEKVYGIEVLLEGFARALRHQPDLRLILAGHGSLAHRVDAIIRTRNLSHAVCRPGRVPNAQVPDYLALADLYVSASFSDGTSVSLLEAMACGLPAVVTDLPTNREWVEEQRNGWLYTAGDAAALAVKIEDAFADPVRLAAMGREAQRVAQQGADWKANVGRLLAAYDALERFPAERVGVSG